MRRTSEEAAPQERIAMHTVLSHIVPKRFSQVNEEVATDALSFILHPLN
jgi:hypothetical protein